MEKIKCYNILILLPLLFLSFSCDGVKKKKTVDYKKIELTAKFGKKITSFYIDSVGNVIAKIMEVQEQDKFFVSKFSNEDMMHINKILQGINFSKCDSIRENYSDGTSYIYVIEDSKSKIEVINGTCKETKALDNLTSYIISNFYKQRKLAIFQGVEKIMPPKLPSINDN